jgi:hypothetical protein
MTDVFITGRCPGEASHGQLSTPGVPRPCHGPCRERPLNIPSEMDQGCLARMSAPSDIDPQTHIGGEEMLMRQRLALAAACVLLVCAFVVGTVFAQAGPPWRIAQGDDGTLYLIAGPVKYELTPDPISDDELAALQEGGPIGGSQLPPQPAPTPTPQPRQPVTITETLGASSQPFALVGNYTVTWTITNPNNDRVFGVSILLQPTTSGLSAQQSIVNNITIPAGQTTTGRAQISNVIAGQYGVSINTGTLRGSPGNGPDWSMTFTPT